MDPLVDALKARGWRIRPARRLRPLLPPAVTRRYPAVPKEVVSFLSRFDLFTSPDEATWFLTGADFRRRKSRGYRWNEIECLMGEDDIDEEVRALDREHWDDHLPFVLSMADEPEYLAVKLSGPLFGAIVHGFVPWGDPQEIAPSFQAFLERFEAEARSPEPWWPSGDFWRPDVPEGRSRTRRISL